MPKPTQPADFFVVGGPVQPDRPCYVVREADNALAESIAAQRFTYVLERRAIGKSSLVGRSVQALRRGGQLAAVIDLSQIGARGDGSDPARWYYSVAHRVLRELRLKLDLQGWWQANAALPSEQRFTEFFAELVLAQTKESVTVFFDDIERTQELPFARQFFAALKSCYSRRVSEPEFERLNFVALGVATPAQLSPDPTLAPFADGRRIELGDFTEAEAARLADGFDLPREQAEGVIAQIYAWTGGHPYLTQKLARGTVRRGGRLADVERAVNQQFLTASAAQSEPLLVQTRRMLTAPGPGMRQAVATLARISAGADVLDDPGAAYSVRLRLAGVVFGDSAGRLRFRNRIFERVFDAAWARSALPLGWRRPAAIAAAVGVIVALPLWYTQLLPAPHIETLESASAPLPALERAYRELDELPGFSGVADRLFVAALSERSRQAQAYGMVQEVDALLREVAGRPERAETLKAEYWLRAAREAMHAERRDAALLLAMTAMAGRPETARALAAELAGGDYGALLRTLRQPVAPVDWAPDWGRAHLTLVDPSHRVDRLDFGVERDSSSPPAPPARLTAPQQVAVSRELTVQESGEAGAFELVVSVGHPRASDLLLRLTAPSGVDATVPLREQHAGEESLRFEASEGSALERLADQERQGLWQLSVVDRESGESGTLLGWALAFDAGGTWRDRLDAPVALPDPVSTEQVEIELGQDGRIALARPTRASPSGALSVWDLANGELVNEFGYEQRPTSVQFTADGRRLVVASRRDVTLWDVYEGTRVRHLETGSEFLLPPAIGVDQQHVAVAERVEAQVPRYQLLSLADGRTLATVNGVAGVDDWALGAGAAYLALRGPGRTVRVIDPSTGLTMAELRHQRDVARVLVVPVNDNRLVTVDAAGEIFVWQLGGREVPAESTHVATTADPASVSIAREAEAIAFVTPRDHVVVRDLTNGFAPSRYRIAGGGGAVSTELAPDASRLWTVRDRVLRLWSVDRTAVRTQPARQLSAVALDAGADLAALGYDGGHVRVQERADAGAFAQLADGVDYIGHRGAVTALDVSAANGLVASGGGDGVVRIWELADAAPNDLYLRHPEGPVRAVAVSPDGRYIASGAELSARIWQVEDGALADEVPVNGAAGAVAFSPDGAGVAVGDTAGNVYFGTVDAGQPLRSTNTGAAATAVTFSPDGTLVASGDASGRLRLWSFDTADAVAPPLVLRHPISWLRFADGDTLFVRSADWLHRVQRSAEGSGLEVTATRLLPLALEAGVALAPRSASRERIVRFVGVREAERMPRRLDVDMSVPLGEPLAAGGLAERDWSRVLSLELDERTGIVRERR